LFVDRAVFSQPKFAVTHTNAAAILQVCRQLDGSPLAIELAAARVNVLSVDQIASRLHDRFRLLTEGTRTALPRQQTLRGAIDWSYDMLSEQERAVLRRLSVFAGGFTLEAAEATCAGAGIAEVEVLDLLAHLVQKSLVTIDEQNAGVRYRLLETVRQYSQEKLLEAGEADDVRRRHRDWCLRLAERAEPGLHGPKQGMRLDQLELEHDNVRAALEWSKVERGGAEAGLRLAGALMWFWYMRGYLSEGRARLEAALAHAGGASPRARAKASIAAAALAFDLGDYEYATPMLESRLAQFQELGDKEGIVHSIFLFGFIAGGRGEYDKAQALLEQGMSLSRELGDKSFIAAGLTALGNIASAKGHYSAARSLYEESLPLRREVGDEHGLANSLGNFGTMTLYQGDYEAAESAFAETLAIRRKLRLKWQIPWSLRMLGFLAQCQRDYERAKALFEESLVLSREVGSKSGTAASLRQLGVVARHQGNYQRATALLAESLVLFRGLGSKSGIAACFEQMAIAAAAQGNFERSTRLFGAEEALREAIAVPLTPIERAEHDHAITATRSELGAKAFAAAWAEGRAMTLEQAIDYALAHETG